MLTLPGKLSYRDVLRAVEEDGRGEEIRFIAAKVYQLNLARRNLCLQHRLVYSQELTNHGGYTTMTVLSEFREFIMRGNAVDLAVGIIIGAAFGNVVTSVTDGVIRPLILFLAPDPSVGLMLGPVDIGRVISAIINFLMTAAVVFFAIVKPMNALRRRLDRSRAADSE